MIILAEASSILNPYAHLDLGISGAASKLGDYFDGIDGALDSGKTVRRAVADEGAVKSAVQRLVAQARMTGFRHGQKISGVRTPALYGDVVKRHAARRANKVDGLMVKSTRSMLKSNMDSEFVLSGDRALRAARYEAGKAYFRGVRDSMGGDYLQKTITAQGDSCDLCTELEDRGYVEFGSEDPPPYHLNCACFLAIRRAR